MTNTQEITYTLDFGVRRRGCRRETRDTNLPEEPASISRLARLMALAIRLDGLVQQQIVTDYATAARLGRVTRARMTQIMRLLDLAPDLQEQILFSAPQPCLNERKLRPILRRVNWDEQRHLFAELTSNRRLPKPPPARRSS